MVGQTPDQASEGLEVKPLTQEEVRRRRRDLLRKVVEMKTRVGNVYVGVLQSAHELGHKFTEILDLVDTLRRGRIEDEEDLARIEWEVAGVLISVSNIAADLISLARQLAVYTEVAEDE